MKNTKKIKNGDVGIVLPINGKTVDEWTGLIVLMELDQHTGNHTFVTYDFGHSLNIQVKDFLKIGVL